MRNLYELSQDPVLMVPYWSHVPKMLLLTKPEQQDCHRNAFFTFTYIYTLIYVCAYQQTRLKSTAEQISPISL